MMNVDTVRTGNFTDTANAVSAVGFQAQALGSSNRATLLLFQNRFIPNQYRRPLQYRFGREFLNDMVETISKSANRPWSIMDTYMPQSFNAKAAILPNATGNLVDLRSMSDQWTFVLIIDEDDGMGVFSGRNGVASRYMYSGWVVDEPVSMTSTINMGAVLNFTRYVCLNERPLSLGMYGVKKTVETQDNWEYANSSILQQTVRDGSALFDMTPGKLMDSVEVGGFGSDNFQYSPNPNSQITPSRFSAEFDPSLGNPTYQLSRIVDGFRTGLNSAKESKDDLLVTQDETMFSAARNAMGTGAHNVSLLGVDPSQPMTIGTLNAKFPNLFVQVFRMPFDVTYNLTDSGSASKRNVFTSIVTSSLPSMMIDVGIMEVSFRYDSYDPTFVGPSNLNPGAIELKNISMFYPTDEENKMRAWDKLVGTMKVCLFPVIRENAGHFSLMVNSSIASATLVNLSLYDEMPEGGFIESNNLLGGIGTDLVGDSNQYQHNACELVNAHYALSNFALGGPASTNVGPVSNFSMGNPTMFN